MASNNEKKIGTLFEIQERPKRIFKYFTDYKVIIRNINNICFFKTKFTEAFLSY